MTRELSQRLFYFTLAAMCVVAVWMSFTWAGTQKDPPKDVWVQFQHTSGGVYTVRKSAVIGYFHTTDKLLQCEVLLQGRGIYTGIRRTPEEFLEKMK